MLTTSPICTTGIPVPPFMIFMVLSLPLRCALMLAATGGNGTRPTATASCQGDSQNPFPQEARVPPRRIPHHAKIQRPSVCTTNIATSTKNVLGCIVDVWRQEIVANWQTRILPGHLAFVSFRRLSRCFFFLTIGQILKATLLFVKKMFPNTSISEHGLFMPPQGQGS